MRAPEPLSSLIIQEHLRRIGPVGLAAVAVGLLVVGVAVAGVLPQWQSVRELRASEADASVQVGRVQRGELKIAVKPEQQALDTLRQQLPGQPQASELIERLYHLASAEHISLARGEYALGIDPKTQLARYQIVLPVRGSYPQIRGFLKGLLGQLPTLVLEDLELQRKRIGDSELNARLRMTLYLSRS
ncbi:MULTISPECIES: type 4a pilus biogenesis protein PilO [unclassified Pseudomonas]|jgi:Tfp pilus assembly protein PilO|uniref:type 4a pilus biogenesis protein PilO n=1 Tax=unclassified Pseudomonas TaxID=196821 RepID=UPI0004259EAD|nr:MULTISPECIES: type 4a pilus biogenesis protein PilO [unclassified Pseudomonas]ATP45270.1 pilus assembly protein PilO [Pseudomonas putida]ATP50080.1 pilus assembly protein PilO [Pseudomonas putida]MBC3485483.1 type 4a pilus biogenesis protein PilO [Pseudomonas sp. SWRI50]MCX2689022.1 type 4a pilus biogenesis protein PilO [Pseudomonas sp. DCB_AW]MDE4540705.1 type 4a pilus biogenesis protein PilO [Pseudomonas sp. ITEM 17296]